MRMVTLQCGGARASVAQTGAELRTWSVDGRDLLWVPDRSVWDAVAPLLFPVVGWTRGGVVRVNGRTYPLGLHGFARNREFAVVDMADDFCRLEDRADEDTHQLYPFDYQLAIEFKMAPSSLTCVAHVGNAGDETMPYAIGFHPGFVWPAKSNSRFIFAKAEAPFVPIITKDGLFAATRRAIPLKDRSVALTRNLLSQEALCFLDMASREFTYEAVDFGRLHVTQENLPHLALWSRPPAPYLCFESWSGYGDPDGFVGDLFEKPSMRMLSPGAIARHAVTYTFASPD